MRPATFLSGTVALGVAVVVLAACGGSDETTDVVSVPTASVAIGMDCGPSPTGGPDSHFYVEGGAEGPTVTCDQAADVVHSIPYSNCDFSTEPECDVGRGWVCRRASEEGADTVVFECTRGGVTVREEAPSAESLPGLPEETAPG